MACCMLMMPMRVTPVAEVADGVSAGAAAGAFEGAGFAAALLVWAMAASERMNARAVVNRANLLVIA
jgi:hypothetical protein